MKLKTNVRVSYFFQFLLQFHSGTLMCTSFKIQSALQITLTDIEKIEISLQSQISYARKTNKKFTVSTPLTLY